ncbi:MAG: peptide chain release factor 1, partial [Archaeoglobi archaeon]|nr:peptide chain release factor 1 [Candidatus Mnemosynella sp.]
QLRDEYGQASNIKSKSTRTNVQSAIESILSRLKYISKPPENGLVIFCGAVAAGADKTEMEVYILEPPEPINIYKYHCDSRFFLEPLEEMLKDKKTYGLIVLDRREATIGILRGKTIEALRYLTSNVPGKHRQGGQSARRFERLREIAIHEFYKRIGDAASEIFLSIDPKDLEGILIGGPSPTKEEFYKGGYLHHELQKKVIGLFDVSYTDDTGLYELVENASEALEQHDLVREKELMRRFMRELAKEDGGLAVYGEEEVRRNLMMGSVDILLISEDLRKVRVKYRCQSCGHKEEVTLSDGSQPLQKKCPKCGGEMSAEETKDIVKELSEIAEQMGTKVEFISTEFEEGEQLLKAFGGMAGILRYRTS